MGNYIGELATAIAGLSAWIFERKKRRQEITRTGIANQQQVIDIYQKTLDDLKNRYDEKFIELEIEIKQLRTHLNLWKEKYRALKEAFDQYKQKYEE